jgi:hypothetical protein
MREERSKPPPHVYPDSQARAQNGDNREQDPVCRVLSVVAHAVDEVTDQVSQARLFPDHSEILGFPPVLTTV